MFLRALKRRKAELEVKLAELQLVQQYNDMLPHFRVPTTVTREGSQWKCMMRSHKDELKCVVAYGDSPAQACENFDALWNGGLIMDDPEEEF